MSEESQVTEASQAEELAKRTRPSLSFESITFSDGQTFTFEEDEIVVLVGPNNAGKSAALRELQQWIKKDTPQKVVVQANLRKIGDHNDLRSYLEKHAQKLGQAGDFRYAGMGYAIYHSHISTFDRHESRNLVADFFSGRAPTETRITGADPAPGIALYKDAPTHPVHLLMMDDKLARTISGHFRRAFGTDLTVFRAGGSSFPLYVGEKPSSKPGEDELSRSYVDALLASAHPLQSQGDGMRSFATVLLHALAVENHTVQFLDEPEAFLHPPQARLLGEVIARERSAKSQLFIATHSTDVLEGLMAGNLDRVRIIRIQRSGDINRVKELSKQKTKEVATDTLTRYSGLFRGIFYKHVFIAESDSDCLFYNTILDLDSVSGDEQPDVTFVHAAGKHRMAKMAETLRELDVPVSVIADVDLISNSDDARKLFEALGGAWADISGHISAIQNAVLSQRAALNADEVKREIQAELDLIGDTRNPFPKSTERAIKQIFRNLSPWGHVKQAGRQALPRGQAVKHFDDLLEKCAAKGLWIVPVGELEGFCPSVMGSHGPGFVQAVLEERELSGDPELETARSFVRRIWQSAKANI